MLKDTNGNVIKLQDNYSGAYLYDAQEWLTFNAINTDAIILKRDDNIKRLEGENVLLKGIIIKQGIRCVTENRQNFKLLLPKESTLGECALLLYTW